MTPAHHICCDLAVMSTSTGHPDGPSWYEIRLQGQLDRRWAAWFDGMTLTTSDGTTVLRGAVADQAALHGLLHKLRDIGLPLVSVTRRDNDRPTLPSHGPDNPEPGD
jgi:hypothetical protein